MSFDFDAPIDRRTSDSRKWHRYAGRDIIPMWIADTDFAAPPAVLEALHARIDHGVFGYGYETRPLKEAVTSYLARQYRWVVDPAWIVWLPGLVTGLNVAAAAFGEPGDEVLCATPVYPPFLSAPTNQGRRTVMAPMARRGNRWELDFDALEAAVTPRTRQFFLCSPHNPVGRAYSLDELEQVAAFCARHNLVLVSDEIHCDLILDGGMHLPCASLSPETAARTVTLMAPSKTYNVPGLGCSFAIIADQRLRTQFVRAIHGIVPDVNVLGYVACEAALRHGEPWRQALLNYLRGNRDVIEVALSRGDLPGITLPRIEATYLAWLDVSSLQLPDAAGFFEQAGVGLSDGAAFGAEKNSHVRLNFGCTRSTLTAALERMKRALAER